VTCLAIALLSACSSSPRVTTSDPGVGSTPPPRPLRDGAPDYYMDVSQIPDATPTPHLGAFKASPYTVLGQHYVPMQDGRNYRETGLASWYGTKFHGQLTANGEDYDLYGMTAAHKTLPLPTYVRVTNVENNKSIIVRVNDRGPFYSDRIIDLSYAGAKKLGFAERGTAMVRVEGIDPVVWQQQNNPGYLVSRDAVQQSRQPVASGQGLYLQVGAFSSDVAAEQLRLRLQNAVNATVFVSPVQQNAQTLHRVRLGPLANHDEAMQIMESLRSANLGTATLVTAN
jgi:rare lipoprotein A